MNFCVVDVDVGLPADEKQAYALAQTIQLQQHLAPAWNADPTPLVRVSTPAAPPLKGEVQIRLMKNATQAGALGFHDQQPDGTPIIYVFVLLAKQYGDAWTSVASHEVGEVLGDPRLRRSVQTLKGFCAQEICDAVEADTYTVSVVVNDRIWAVAMSNFCTPAWFEPSQSNPYEKYDYLGLCKAAGEVRAGGYAQYFDPQKGWQMINAMRVPGYRDDLRKMGIGRTTKRGGTSRRPWWKRLLGVA
jgi:hypothetical protein